MTAYDELAAHIAEYHDMLCILNTLKWDMRTMMPAAGAASRGRQLATLTTLAKSIFVSEETARLLDAAESEVASADSDSYRARALQQIRDAYEIHRRIPSDLVAQMAALGAESEAVWAKSRTENDFPSFKPYLSQMLALNIELAEAIGYDAHPFDALILQFEPGMTAARLERIFAELKARILPLLERIVAADAPLSVNLWAAEYDLAAQEQLCRELTALIGFDYERGRLDSAPHPFEISFTRDDVRITTRYDANYLPMSLFAALHEAGHGIYEQNIAPELTRTALSANLIEQYAVGGASDGAHEFSSRLWENQIGRSREFWRLHFSRLRARFPDQMAAANAELFYRAVNRVRPSLIRVEADEVTYNLHIMLRTEIEMALLEGAIAVDDLPEVWNAKMQEYLGLTPPDDRRGVLQDVHWSFGGFGKFPAYTIGNIMAAQVLEAAHKQMPALAGKLAEGDYRTLLEWLREYIYRHSRAYSTDELLTRISGEGLNTAPLLEYLEGKYSDLYGLN